LISFCLFRNRNDVNVNKKN